MLREFYIYVFWPCSNQISRNNNLIWDFGFNRAQLSTIKLMWFTVAQQKQQVPDVINGDDSYTTKIIYEVRRHLSSHYTLVIEHYSSIYFTEISYHFLQSCIYGERVWVYSERKISMIRGLTYYEKAFVCEAENNPQTTNEARAYALSFVAADDHVVPSNLNLQPKQKMTHLEAWADHNQREKVEVNMFVPDI